jgi:hypothetical protein
MMRSGIVMKATAQGRASASVSPTARICERWAASVYPAAIRRLISGSSTVPAAMPMTPTGSW